MTIRKPVDLKGLQQAFPYPRSTSEATSDLAPDLIKSIQETGPLPFVDYMARCLYDADRGYYSRPDVLTVSKEGDFITSVSVGHVFGRILAARLHLFWVANGSPAEFCVLEPGGHDGSLAKDILSGASAIDPNFSNALQYKVYEPHPARRQLLSARLGSLASVISSPDELSAPIGAVVANEVLDALPVPLYLHSAQEWHEVAVTAENNQLEWTTLDTQFTLKGEYPDGYVTEGSPDLPHFLKPLAEIFEKALMIFVDYGLDEDSLYHPDRHVGTLRCYRSHRSNVHPLDEPGTRDLTADVNFTAVERAATALGLDSYPLMNQSRYLTYCGRDWLLSSPSQSEVRQFQTLIHPSQFGNRFHIAEFTKGDTTRGFPA
ncbi:MAG: SAM-dependent methyltransferase [Akkermansiaceae bacterium]|jgi:SAM-dependent MidA family methyltransferase